MKLKAELQPLAGKYYGSIISVSNDEGKESEIHVWINSISDYKPSERELKAHAINLIREGFSSTEIKTNPDLAYEISNDHYETQTAFKVCEAIVKALDGLEVESAA